MSKRISLSSNILVSYFSQIYVAAIGIIMVPVYIKYMGAEAYGLVGFFVMLLAFFQLLDMGLIPTMVRETARFHGGATDALSYRRFVRALEGLFFTVALVAGSVLLVSSGYIANDWLRSSQLPIAEVKTAVQLMAFIIALRWMCGLYRGVISGSEHFVWLGKYNCLIATSRFVVVLPVLMFIGVTPTIFFSFQFGVEALELAVLMFYAYRLLPRISKGQRLPWEWAPIKPLLKFSLTIAFTSSAWVLISQTDKLTLSKILPLAEYGYFTLAVMVAGGVVLLIGPVTGAIMPHMVRLEAEGNQDGSIKVYRMATQLVAVISGSVSITLAYCAEPLLFAWTGSETIAHNAGPILTLYAFGNGIVAMTGFPYLLQYAKGNLRLHLIGSVLFVVLLLPTVIWSASQYGGVGAGYVWLTLNLLFLFTWVPYVHNKFIPSTNMKWLGQDVLLIYVAPLFVGYFLKEIMDFSGGRIWQLFLVFLFALAVLIASATSSTFFWTKSRTLIGRFYEK